MASSRRTPRPLLPRFDGESGEMVVSGSEDGTVRRMSTWKDTKQQNLGTGGSMSASKVPASLSCLSPLTH